MTSIFIHYPVKDWITLISTHFITLITFILSQRVCQRLKKATQHAHMKVATMSQSMCDQLNKELCKISYILL